MLWMREFHGDCDMIPLLQRWKKDDAPWVLEHWEGPALEDLSFPITRPFGNINIK